MNIVSNSRVVHGVASSRLTHLYSITQPTFFFSWLKIQSVHFVASLEQRGQPFRYYQLYFVWRKLWQKYLSTYYLLISFEKLQKYMLTTETKKIGFYLISPLNFVSSTFCFRRVNQRFQEYTGCGRKTRKGGHDVIPGEKNLEMSLKQFVDKILMAEKYSLKFSLSFHTNICNDRTKTQWYFITNYLAYFPIRWLDRLPRKMTLRSYEENRASQKLSKLEKG